MDFTVRPVTGGSGQCSLETLTLRHRASGATAIHLVHGFLSAEQD